MQLTLYADFKPPLSAMFSPNVNSPFTYSKEDEIESQSQIHDFQQTFKKKKNKKIKHYWHIFGA